MTRGRPLDPSRLVAAVAALCLASVSFIADAATQEEPQPTPEIAVTTQAESSVDPIQGSLPPAASIEAQPLKGVGARAAALLLSDQSGGEVDGAVTWTSSGPVGETGRIPIQVFVEVAGRNLLTDTGDPPVEIDVFGYVTSDEGALLEHLAQSVHLDDRVQIQRIQEGGLRFIAELDVPPGVHSFRVLVANRKTFRFFLGGYALGIPADEPDTPFLLPPLVGETSDTWTVAVESGVREATVLDNLPGETPWPSAIPIWRSGEPLGIVVGGAEETAFNRMATRLLDRSGQTLFEPEIEIGALLTAGNGLAFYRASIEPSSVPAGEYRVEVFVTDESGNETASQSMSLLVDDRSGALAWTDSDSPRVRSSVAGELALGPPVADEVRADGPVEASQSDGEAGARELLDTDPERFVGGRAIEQPPTGPIEALQLTSVDARGAALLLSGQSGGDVAGAVVWAGGAGGTDDGLVPIHLFVEVDGGELLAGSAVLPIPIEVYGYLLNSSGSLVAHIAEGFLLDGRLLAKKIDLTGFKFAGGLRASPDVYSFRILVRNRQTGRFFLARRDMNLRSGGRTEPWLMPPLVPEPDDSWLIGLQHGLHPDDLKREVPGLDSWPSAMPVWRADQPLEFVLTCSELGEGQAVSAQVFDRLGNRVLDLAVEVVSSIASADGLGSYHATVAATDLPADQYRLMIQLADSESGQTASQSLPVLIHGLPSTFVWTDPAAPRETGEPPRSPLMDVPGGESLEAEAMRAAYIDALRLWAAGDVVAARRTLAELEGSVEASGSARGWRQLITLERVTAMSLTGGHPASILGVAFLHRDMFSWYLARGESGLSTHSWQMAATMARIAPGIKNWDPPDGFSESMLIDLAGLLVRSGQPRTARQLLEAAAKVAPGSAPALLGIGALNERIGHPEEAVAPLKTLVENHPDDSEGRLRLAVNLERTGSEKNAEEHFRALLAPSVTVWVRTLAYQELGRMLVQQEREGEAIEVLSEGAAQIPDNQRLRILLAHALDAGQRPRDATSVIEELEAKAAQQTTSPRYRYSMWPDLGGERIHSTLVAAEAEGGVALREALQ